MKTWAIQLTIHISNDHPNFDPREWSTAEILDVAGAPTTAKQWRFTELIQGETTTAHEALMHDGEILMEVDPTTT
jgi:hypothetical protein